jgi:hypothetical protein
MVLLGELGYVESCFGPFGDSVVSVQDRCTVCDKCTISTEPFWTHQMVLLSDEAQVEVRFKPFRDNVSVDAG